jgi:phospholipid/cholesterol/gamma-HCH transport system substrate-binding protein
MRLGVFIAGTLLAFGAGMFWIGNRELRFTPKYRLNADFPNAAGLGEGATVRVGGIHEGTVHRILLPQRPDLKVRVEMDLREATRNVIKKDSLAAIRTEGLLGDQYVEISFGSVGAPKVNDGDTIAAEPPLQISDMLKRTNSILDSAQAALRNIDQTAANLQAISSKLNAGKGTAGALVNDRSVYEHMNQAAENLQEDTEALKHNFFLRGFFKERGFADRAELERNAISQLPATTPEDRLSYRAAELFDKADTAKIKNGKLLDEAGRYLEQNSYGFVVVASYADQKGDSDKQLELTQARASVVRGYLSQHFRLDDTRIKTLGGGKSPDAPGGGEVQVIIYPPGTAYGRPRNTEPYDPKRGKKSRRAR